MKDSITSPSECLLTNADFDSSYSVRVYCCLHGWEDCRYTKSGNMVTCDGSLHCGKQFTCKLCNKQVATSQKGMWLHFSKLHLNKQAVITQ